MSKAVKEEEILEPTQAKKKKREKVQKKEFVKVYNRFGREVVVSRFLANSMRKKGELFADDDSIREIK